MNNRIVPAQFFAKALLCSSLFLLMTACEPSRPSEKDGEALLAPTANTATTKLVGFRKTNGQDANLGGVQGYRMSWEATIECTSTKGCCIRAGQGWPFGPARAQSVKKGERYTTTGKIYFEKSEKGSLGRFEE
jgi:hypothetical protein